MNKKDSNWWGMFLSYLLIMLVVCIAVIFWRAFTGEEKHDETTPLSYTLTSTDTSFKSYMDYRCLTDENSVQYDIQQKAYTDENGLRRCGELYIVALGTAYAQECGGIFEITLDAGETITAIVGDIKGDSCTDVTNSYTPIYDEYGNYFSANYVEFIVDTDELDSFAKLMGDVSYIEGLEGNVTSIVQIFEEDYNGKELLFRC